MQMHSIPCHDGQPGPDHVRGGVLCAAAVRDDGSSDGAPHRDARNDLGAHLLQFGVVNSGDGDNGAVV